MTWTLSLWNRQDTENTEEKGGGGGVVVLTQTNHTAVGSVTWLEPLPWDLTSPLCHAKDSIPEGESDSRHASITTGGGGLPQHQEKGANLLSSGFLKDRLPSFYKKKNVRREVSGRLLYVQESSLPNAKTALCLSVHLYSFTSRSPSAFNGTFKGSGSLSVHVWTPQKRAKWPHKRMETAKTMTSEQLSEEHIPERAF